MKVEDLGLFGDGWCKDSGGFWCVNWLLAQFRLLHVAQFKLLHGAGVGTHAKSV